MIRGMILTVGTPTAILSVSSGSKRTSRPGHLVVNGISGPEKHGRKALSGISTQWNFYCDVSLSYNL